LNPLLQRNLRNWTKLPVNALNDLSTNWLVRQIRDLGGIALQGEAYDGLWRYRVGDYRLICQIKDKEVLILILEIGHRKAIYR